MSDEQVMALMLMLLAGMFGLAVFFEGKHKAVRVAGVVWAAVWWFPPLVMLWIKGVFG